MSLKDQIKQHMKDAMRARESARLETIRMLRAAIQRREVDGQIELDDDGVLNVVQKMVKQGEDSATQFTKGERPELAAKELESIKVLQTYLPARLSEAEIGDLMDQAFAATGAAEMKDMGKVMGWLKPKIQGRADMAQLSAQIKARLAGG